MRKHLMSAVILLGVLFAGFFVGQKVQAGTSDPGTISDPLVSKSYVDNLINKIDAVTTRVTALETENVALKKKVEYLSSLKAAPATRTATVITATANIRSGAGTTYKIIKKVYKNSKFTVVSQPSKYWYKIKVTASTYGYLHSSTVSVK